MFKELTKTLMYWQKEGQFDKFKGLYYQKRKSEFAKEAARSTI